VIRSQVIRLNPDRTQEEFFRRCVGTARFAFNWGLQSWNDRYVSGQKVVRNELGKELNAIKREQFPWMLDVPKGVVQQSIKNLEAAYQNFFASCTGRRRGPQMALPTFKSKHRSKQSARLDNGPGTFRFDGCSVKLPKIGWVQTHEALRFAGRPLSTSVSFVGDRWWISVQVELPDAEPTAQVAKPSVGVDLGLKTALVLSDGRTFESPKPLKEALDRLKRLGRRVSRKMKGSSNRAKAVKTLCRQHWRVAQIRKDWQHKTTTTIAKSYGAVGLEDLNVRGLLSNRRLARVISDVGFSEIRRQLEYKCAKVITVDRWFPSSKLCSKCGHKKETLSLSERVFCCEKCGFEIDRDLNAASNIHTASCAGINACGVEGSGLGVTTETKPATTKQELDRRIESAT
jgi:putative transposase